MSKLESLIIETMGCTEHEARIKASTLVSDFVCENPEQILKLQEEVLKTKNEQIHQLEEDKFTLASNHLAFMANYPKPNSDINFLSIKDMSLSIKGGSFDDFIIKNGMNLSVKEK